MPLVNGTFNSIGESITIQLDPIANAVGFNYFTEGVGGESAPDKVFIRDFRYSTDGGYVFTPWTTLTNGALNAIPSDVTALYWFEVRYMRGGTDATGTLQWNTFSLDVTVNLSAQTTFFPLVFSFNNIFGDIHVNDPLFQQLCGNLHDKIVKPGIIPEYIERTEEFKHFWKRTCCFLALHWVFAEKFGRIYEDRQLLRAFVQQRGLFICGTETLAELQDVAENYYQTIKDRGTERAITEIMRMICNCSCCEFIFAMVGKFESGWTVDRSSPLYRGANGIRNMNKLPTVERDGPVVDLANYYLMSPGVVSIVSENDNDGDAVDVLEIDDSTATAGIGFDNHPEQKRMTAKLNYPVTNGYSMNYEVSAMWKQPVAGAYLSMGVECFDCDGNVILDATLDLETGLPTKWFFRNQGLAQTTHFEQFRGIVFNENEALRSAADATLTVGFGRHLKANPVHADNIKYCYPIFVHEGGGGFPGNRSLLYNVRFGLCSLPWALSFVGVMNFLLMFYTNNNGSITNAQMNARIRRYMIPMNANMIPVNLP